MARTKYIDCDAGAATVTTFVGPARLSDRRCLQIGDAVVLDGEGVLQLHELLGYWLVHKSLPPDVEDLDEGDTP